MSRLNLSSLDKDNLKIPYPEDERVKTIKGKATNQYITVIPQKLNNDTYAVSVNDQCVYGFTDKYELRPCDKLDNIEDVNFHPQYFEIKKVFRENERRIMGNKPDKKGEYPYTAFIHKSTQHCLTVDNKGLYLTDCDSNNLYQKWLVSPNENICPEL